jgi:hypothetical protein
LIYPEQYQNEEFDVRRGDDGYTCACFSLNNNGEKNDTPFYSRKFIASETKEIRLYGLSGTDKYLIDGNGDNNIKIRIIDVTGSDTLHIPSQVKEQ